MGNVAAYRARLKDHDLIDCGLTPKGHEQARNIPQCLGEQAYQQIELGTEQRSYRHTFQLNGDDPSTCAIPGMFQNLPNEGVCLIFKDIAKI
jgi:hypothetical protein